MIHRDQGDTRYPRRAYKKTVDSVSSVLVVIGLRTVGRREIPRTASIAKEESGWVGQSQAVHVRNASATASTTWIAICHCQTMSGTALPHHAESCGSSR